MRLSGPTFLDTTQRLQDSYTTITLIESQMNDSLHEHVCRLKSNMQSLQRLLVSCETSLSTAENSVSFYPQPSPRMEGRRPRRPVLNITKEQTEYLRSIHFSWEKKSPVASHKCLNASKEAKGVRNK